jgi:hypothetical protein
MPTNNIVVKSYIQVLSVFCEGANIIGFLFKINKWHQVKVFFFKIMSGTSLTMDVSYQVLISR